MAAMSATRCALQGAAQAGQELVDALVGLLLIEVQIGGDVGDASGVPEAKLKNEAVLRIECGDDFVEHARGGAGGLFAVAPLH